MKRSIAQPLIGVVAIASLLTSFIQSATAGTLRNGWNYSIDSFNDGTDNRITGSNSRYEFYSMAFTEVGDRLYFAFKSNLPFDPSAPDTNGVVVQEATATQPEIRISYSDLFLNVTHPSRFSQANGQLYAIHFDASNDTARTGRFPLGLYRNVTVESRTPFNQGYPTLQGHTDAVTPENASYGDLEEDTPYFGNPTTIGAPTTMQAGEYIGGLTFHTREELGLLGLDFAALGVVGNDIDPTATVPTQTFGFSIERALLSEDGGNVIASLFAECGNDGIVLAGDLQDVPEPSLLVGMATVAGLAIKRQRRR